MRILFVSTEAEPFAKSGGLGDVIGSLPKALINQGAQVRIILPLYRSIKQNYSAEMTFLGAYTVDLSWRRQYCGLYRMDCNGIVHYFIDNERYFDRETYYGYFDDGERFAFFSKAVLEMMPKLEWKPDILHCSEWQTALVPIYLKTEFERDPFYDQLLSVFTIHNVEYQGQFDTEVSQDLFGISQEDYPIVEHRGQINLMKGAIVCCDKLTTVSPTYAEELRDPHFSHQLHSVIRQYAYKLSGIINGIDMDKYDPAKDPYLLQNYSSGNPKRKSANKKGLQKQLSLNQEPEVPIIGMIGRMVPHKGMDIIEQAFDDIMSMDLQLAILGTGDQEYENFFREKSLQYPGRVSTSIYFSPQLANRIYAGSDLFLMPSRSEPCGIAQMIALRYGTVPIVRETGGLKDSIQPYAPVTQKGNGITFLHYEAHELLDAVRRSIALYKDPVNWNILIRNTYRSDFSWEKSAQAYMDLYHSLIGVCTWN